VMEPVKAFTLGQVHMNSRCEGVTETSKDAIPPLLPPKAVIHWNSWLAACPEAPAPLVEPTIMRPPHGEGCKRDRPANLCDGILVRPSGHLSLLLRRDRRGFWGRGGTKGGARGGVFV